MKARALLGKQRHTTKHIPSLPFQDAPAFYRFLSFKDTITALALRFLMLTVARAGEVRFAIRDEIDGDIWTIPAERTKQGKQHRVPLVPEALLIVETATREHTEDLIFPVKSGKPMSDAAMGKFMKDNSFEARPHGLRSTFRSWAEEQTAADWETKEMCLGHTVGGKVERAYQRSDLLDKRRALLENWVEFLTRSNL